ncbi:hypothetical protein ACS0TY_004339 [Phlomoides rotata]
MDSKLVQKLKPYILIIFLQFANAGFGIVAKAALNQGSSHYTFAVYRNAFAAAVFLPFAFVLERKTRPKMTLGIFMKILLLGVLDPVIGQNMFYAGLKYSTATFTAAMCNLLPALTFVLAWALRIEKVKLKEIRSHAKIVGTLVTVGGAMILTFIRGAVIELPWTHKSNDATSSTSNNSHNDPIKASILLLGSNIIYSSFFIIQAITLKSYPTALSLTALVCTLGALIGTVLTFIVERGNTAVWALGWNARLLGYVYGGIVASGMSYYISGVIMKDKGPVFVTAFNPLSMVAVAVMSSFIFAEQMTVGMVVGGAVIVIGLYLVIWGKSKDQKLVQLVQQQHKTATPNSLAKAADKEDDGSEKISGHNAV